MAQIKSVLLKQIPDIIYVGDTISDIEVITEIEFHPLDISLEMEYLLFLFVYDIHGKPNIPIILSNWKGTNFFGMPQDGKDDLLGKKTITVEAKTNYKTIETSIALKLGNLEGSNSYHKRKLEVLATLIPAVGRASKWSTPFETQIVF